jgi:hypothetical protein
MPRQPRPDILSIHITRRPTTPPAVRLRCRLHLSIHTTTRYSRRLVIQRTQALETYLIPSPLQCIHIIINPAIRLSRNSSSLQLRCMTRTSRNSCTITKQGPLLPHRLFQYHRLVDQMSLFRVTNLVKLSLLVQTTLLVLHSPVSSLNLRQPRLRHQRRSRNNKDRQMHELATRALCPRSLISAPWQEDCHR